MNNCNILDTGQEGRDFFTMTMIIIKIITVILENYFVCVDGGIRVLNGLALNLYSPVSMIVS